MLSTSRKGQWIYRTELPDFSLFQFIYAVLLIIVLSSIIAAIAYSFYLKWACTGANGEQDFVCTMGMVFLFIFMPGLISGILSHVIGCIYDRRVAGRHRSREDIEITGTDMREFGRRLASQRETSPGRAMRLVNVIREEPPIPGERTSRSHGSLVYELGPDGDLLTCADGGSHLHSLPDVGVAS